MDRKKETETVEEKRVRRLAKKETKERSNREKIGLDSEYLGYTNDDNPFGDHSLSETFVWKKKLSKDGLNHLSYEEIQKIQKHKMEANKRELEAVRRRRMEREKEREDRDKDIEMMQREKEADYYDKWEQQEDNFHLEQAKLRSRIRIADGRAKPIDLLSKYISDQESKTTDIEEEELVDMHEPTQFLVGLSSRDLEDLLEDIKVVYIQLEQGANADFWRDITTIVEDELRKLSELSADENKRRQTASIISEPVLKEISGILKGKTYSQLQILGTQVKKKLESGGNIDVNYWETLLQKLQAQSARTRLRERHEDFLRKRLEQLKQEQGVLAEPLFPSFSDKKEPGPSTSCASTSAASSAPEKEKSPNDTTETTTTDAPEETPTAIRADTEEIVRENYDSGRYSPALMRIEDLEIDAVVYNPTDEKQKLQFQRQQVITTGRLRSDAEEELMKRAREGMDDDEAQFSVQVPLEDQSFLWSDKYRPRKPRFFNRVHTGFEWNKYNQTHYDLDNPPPKIVQGYKFNIFYPDLIDKNKTPTYTLTPDENNSKDFVILRFKTGPPYEDIGFKIVNREWEYSYKRGFRCQFQNNIFQLWFHFKRFRYRR